MPALAALHFLAPVFYPLRSAREESSISAVLIPIGKAFFSMSPAAPLPKFAKRDEAMRLVRRLGREFAIVKNPGYVFPPYEAYPLAPKIRRFKNGIVGIVKDMDGTTTTTEALCLHSLETMVRRITQRPDAAQWVGFDRKRDLPHIIGNSTTRHVEYLVQTYNEHFVPEATVRAFIEAAAWTLSVGRDPGRREEVLNDVVNLGIRPLLEDAAFKKLLQVKSYQGEEAKKLVAALTKKYRGAFLLKDFSQQVRAAIDIYYYRYHEILVGVRQGRGEQLSRQILREAGRRLIEPMPGVAIFLSLIKGWLPQRCEALVDELADHLAAHKVSPEKIKAARAGFGPVLRYFAANPLRVAVVTSSIQYEAEIVLDEVFRVLREQIAEWPVDKRLREKLIPQFQSPRHYYDAFITATDSSEIRLKPHRDLYSIALHRLGLKPNQFHQVAGFEDSESGTIAIRAAGVGCSVALPFAETKEHNLRAASVIAKRGLPEVMLLRGMLLDPRPMK
jgi:beta-phosphoglucomutase-like phosphatase (HAD superfamily)